jgi:hypothetical protein
MQLASMAKKSYLRKGSRFEVQTPSQPTDYSSRALLFPLPRNDDGQSFGRTFYGGADESFAALRDTHSYFRNIQLWGSSQASNLTGPVIESSAISVPALRLSLTFSLCGVVLFLVI